MNYLINNTTKEQRKEIVKKALSIILSNNQMPSDGILKLVEEYIDGKTELKDVQEKIVELYRR